MLGTKFNIKAYGEEPSFITLTEGKVEVITNDEEQKNHYETESAGILFKKKRD